MRKMLLKLASERIGAARALLLGALLALASGCGAKPVTSVATEADAIEILDVLGQSGLDAEKREVGEGEARRWEIVVGEDFFGGGNAALAVQVLRDHGLPRPEEPVNEESGLIPSERAEKLREQRRIRADIERQLRALPGVTLALVTVVMPQDPTLELNPYPASASVVVIHKEQSAPFTEQQIQNLVAKGVPKLKPEDVSVTISQQQPRPLPRRELAARRRTNLLLAAAVALILVLGSLLVMLLLQTRRLRARLAAAGASDTLAEAAEVDDTEPGGEEAAGELPADGDGARRRELAS
jgi:type III secretory pathway lipoprotein EscJ